MEMKKVMVSMTEEMVQALEKERKKKMMQSIPEVVRQIVSDYFSKSSH